MKDATLTAAAWVRRIAASHPQDMALIDGQRSCTHADLNARSERLAAALVGAGLVPGDRVAALLINGIPLIELYFAAAKARVTLLPLNWRLAPPELSYILGDANPRLLFFSEELADLAAAIETPARRIIVAGTACSSPDAYEHFLTCAAPDIALPDAEPDDSWIMLYTSGTTGRPKGCLLDQRGQIVSALASAALWRARSDDRLIVALPLFHIGGLAILFAHMIVGAGAVIAPRVLSAETALQITSDHGCTRAAIAPQLYAGLVEVQRKRHLPLRLALLSMGGGMHEPGQIEAVRTVLGADILLGYGQTEAGNFISYLSADEQYKRPRSCGRAMPHLDIAVVDENDVPVPTGASGELVVRGASILQRYWNQPEATAQTLRGGWLHTGDLVTIDEDGYLTLLGRLKELIKTGGENVYPREVETVLLDHPAIADCVVYGVADAHWGEAVKAAIVTVPGATLDGAAIVAWCRQHIAGYKRPRFIEFLQELPRSDSGKLLMPELKMRAVTPDQAVD